MLKPFSSYLVISFLVPGQHILPTNHILLSRKAVSLKSIFTTRSEVLGKNALRAPRILTYTQNIAYYHSYVLLLQWTIRTTLVLSTLKSTNISY